MMLLRYKKTYEKIAMGLLSYMPGYKNVKKLQDLIQQYEHSEEWQLFLLKKDEDFLGLIGIELDESEYILHHISVNPSFRGEGIGHELVIRVQALYPEKECKGTDETSSFLMKCIEKEEGADQ